MPKINVYLPDELAEAVKEARIPVSAVCQQALEQAVQRLTAIREVALDPQAQGDDPTERMTQFTARTRAVIKLAHEQARTEGAPVVGTRHLLGGLLAEGGNLAMHVLRALEIEPDQVRRELDGQPPADDTAAVGRYSSQAAGALELSATEALGLGHNYIGCEHLLLGLIAEPGGTAGQTLRALGAEQRLTRRAVAAALAGYVHLRAQGQQQGAPAADPAGALRAAIQQELQPIVERLERLEERVAGD